MNFQQKDQYDIQDLLEIVSILRSPQGCPWDREQTHKSIRKNFIEETYEAVEAIDTENTSLLQEELGDVLLQILLHSEMEAEKETFDFGDVVDGLAKKLVFRHPHVFQAEHAATPEEALRHWEQSKRVEKGQQNPSDTLQQVSTALPALMYSEKVQKRAAKIGFDYHNTLQALEHLKEEIHELEEAILQHQQAEIQEELGDVLFSTVNVARFVAVDPEHALFDSTAKFVRRFTQMEWLGASRGIDLEWSNLDEMNRLWKEVKEP